MHRACTFRLFSILVCTYCKSTWWSVYGEVIAGERDDTKGKSSLYNYGIHSRLFFFPLSPFRLAPPPCVCLHSSTCTRAAAPSDAHGSALPMRCLSYVHQHIGTHHLDDNNTKHVRRGNGRGPGVLGLGRVHGIRPRAPCLLLGHWHSRPHTRPRPGPGSHAVQLGVF